LPHCVPPRPGSPARRVVRARYGIVNFSIQMIDTDGPHSGAYPIGKNEGPATMAEPIFYDDFVKLELRVATVLEARPHPNADKLLLSS
ncbi:MAG: hypothetical protein ABSE84_14840, partial [Isosphaeraceae bacterium]